MKIYIVDQNFIKRKEIFIETKIIVSMEEYYNKYKFYFCMIAARYFLYFSILQFIRLNYHFSVFFFLWKVLLSLSYQNFNVFLRLLHFVLQIFACLLVVHLCFKVISYSEYVFAFLTSLTQLRLNEIFTKNFPGIQSNFFFSNNKANYLL